MYVRFVELKNMMISIRHNFSFIWHDIKAYINVVKDNSR